MDTQRIGGFNLLNQLSVSCTRCKQSRFCDSYLKSDLKQCALILFSEMALICCCVMNYIKARQRLKTRIESNIKGYPCSVPLNGPMRSISIHLKAPSWKTGKERAMRDSLLLHIPASCGQLWCHGTSQPKRISDCHLWTLTVEVTGPLQLQHACPAVWRASYNLGATPKLAGPWKMNWSEPGIDFFHTESACTNIQSSMDSAKFTTTQLMAQWWHY